jgi:two-component system sensor histidine kinase EvgS
VRIESEPHEGCVVSFLFNATPSAKITLHHPTPDSVASLHILVVDDYPPARQTLQQRLESWGHRVSLATQEKRRWQCGKSSQSVIPPLLLTVLCR